MGEKITEQWLREFEQSEGHGTNHSIVWTDKLFDLTREVRRLQSENARLEDTVAAIVKDLDEQIGLLKRNIKSKEATPNA